MSAAWEGSGVYTRIDGGHRAMRGHLERELEFAVKAGVHLWTAMACFKVSVDELARGTDVPMDAENLLTIEVGCYRCEAAYEPRLARRACPGDPVEIRGAGARWR